MTPEQHNKIVAVFEAALAGRKLGSPGVADDVMTKIRAALPDVTGGDIAAALKEHADERVERARQAVGHIDRIIRLARATNAPPGSAIFPWLIKKGLIVKTPSGALVFTPKASVGGKGGFEPIVDEDGRAMRLDTML